MLSIVRSFARKVGYVLRDRQIATRASPYADRPSVTSCAQTHTMKTVQVSRRSASYRRRLFAAGALSAVVALSHVDSAAAVACATDTFYDGTTVDSAGTNSGLFDANADCTPCIVTGTTAAAIPDGTSATFCEGVKAGFAGTPGSGADATITGCDSGYYIATVAFNAATSNTDTSGLVCTQVPANKYFTTTTTTPLEVTTAEAPTACPNDSTSTAGSTVLADCECAANFYPSSNTCVACASGTTRAGTVSVTGTATCSAAAESAGASTPTAVALAAAAAVPLLL